MHGYKHARRSFVFAAGQACANASPCTSLIASRAHHIANPQRWPRPDVLVPPAFGILPPGRRDAMTSLLRRLWPACLLTLGLTLLVYNVAWLRADYCTVNAGRKR
jgi:hypothetical protein